MSAFDFENFFAEVDNAAVDAGKYEAPGGDFDKPIPNNTRLPVIVERAEYYDQDNITLSLMWRVTGGEHANRVIFQKLLLAGQDKWAPAKSEDKRKKARTQLAIMVKLTRAGKVEQELRTGNLPAIGLVSEGICGKPLEITVATYKMTGDDGQVRQGNWVKAVGAQEARLPLQSPKDDVRVTQPRSPLTQTLGAALPNDEIPF